MPTYELPLPCDNTIATRLEWAGERYADLVEGQCSPEIGWFVWNAVMGWTDLCSEDERRQYLAMANQLEEYLHGQEGA